MKQNILFENEFDEYKTTSVAFNIPNINTKKHNLNRQINNKPMSQQHNNTTQEEEDVDWNNNQQQQQHNEQIDADQFNQHQQDANQAAAGNNEGAEQNNNNNTDNNQNPPSSSTYSPPGSAASKNRQPMAVPVASLAGGALNTNNNNKQPPNKKSQQLSNNLLDSSRKVTTRERQREREYKKVLLQQERGNADVDYSNWESGNAPDTMTLRVASAVTNLVRDTFSNITAMRREIRQRNVDATANGSPLSEEAGRAVQEAMQTSLYPLTTGLVDALEDGLRSVMPLFSSSMRNTEGLNTLVQIRDQLHREASFGVDEAAPSSTLTDDGHQEERGDDNNNNYENNNTNTTKQQDFIPLPPTSSSRHQQQQSARANHHKISRLDIHPVYDREAESDNHMQVATVSPRFSSSSTSEKNNNYMPMNNSATSLRSTGGSAMNQMTNGPQPILTTITQVQSRINESAEAWPADHRRHQAHSTIHQKVHPTKADAAKRVSDAKTKLLQEHNVQSIVPPVLNKLLLASLPQSARQHSHQNTTATTDAEGRPMSGRTNATSTTTSIADMKKQYRREMIQKQQQQQHNNNDNNNNTTEQASPGTVRRRHNQRIKSDHEDLMARYPTNTVDGFSARILSLHEPKLSSGIWRQLSVNEKQQIIAFEQRENRYHHLHGVTNMKLAGLRMKIRRSQKSGIELSAGDYAALAEADRRKKILEEQRASDVRQTAMLVRQWLPALPDQFEK